MKKRIVSMLVAALMLTNQCSVVMAEELFTDISDSGNELLVEGTDFVPQEETNTETEDILSAEEVSASPDDYVFESEEEILTEDVMIQEESLFAEDENFNDIEDEIIVEEIQESEEDPMLLEAEEPEETQEPDEVIEEEEVDEIADDILETEEEPELVGGSTMSTATRMYFGSSYSGSITSSTTSQYYKLVLSSSGRVTMNATAYMQYIYYYLYDVNGNRIDYWSVYWDSAAGKSVREYKLDLTAGTYYWGVVRYSSYYTGSYRMSAEFTSAGESFTRNDNLMETSNGISLDTTYKGQIAKNDEKDFYRFNLSTSGKLKLNMTAYMEYVYYYLYDAKGNRIDYWSVYWDRTTGKSVKTIEIDLSGGTYYLGVARYASYYTGNYLFKLSLETLPRSWITKLVDIGSGGVRIYWKQLTGGVDGYQIRWSTDSTFKSGVKTASYTDRNNAARENLSVGRTYYIGVRTYVIRNSKKVYSKWSNTKSIYLSRTLQGTSIWNAENNYGKIKVNWYSVSGVDGYQLRYAKNSDFTGAKTASFSGSSRTVVWRSYFSTYYTWYVSIRAYKTAYDGTRYYSRWSPARRVY